MAPSVQVSNIAPGTSEEALRQFFTFCGTVTDIDVYNGAGNTQNATIFFEDNAAADTAAMLDGTVLDNSPLGVTRADKALESVSPPPPPAYQSEHDVPQSHKPRRRILAEMLAHGYHLTDQVIAKVLEMDKQRGFSSKLEGFLKDLDKRFKPEEQVRGIDTKYNVSGQIANLANSWKSYLTPYYESASKSPTGTRLREFYATSVESAQQVHKEAMWIKKNQLQKKGCQCKSATKEACTCAPGSCKCSTSEKSASSCPCGAVCGCSGASGPSSTCACQGKCDCASEKSSEKKTCECGAKAVDCACPEGTVCDCDTCPRTKSGSSEECACKGDASKCTCTSEKCACKPKLGDKELYQ